MANDVVLTVGGRSINLTAMQQRVEDQGAHIRRLNVANDAAVDKAPPPPAAGPWQPAETVPSRVEYFLLEFTVPGYVTRLARYVGRRGGTRWFDAAGIKIAGTLLRWAELNIGTAASGEDNREHKSENVPRTGSARTALW